MSAINNRLNTFGVIQKRTILFDNEVKKETLTEGHSLHYGDRFIPRRCSHNNAPTTHTSTTKSNNCTKTSGLYAERLRSALGLKISRQLPLTDYSIPRPFFTQSTGADGDEPNFMYFPQQVVCSSPTRYKDLDWMCKPRKKPKVDANSSHEFEGFEGTVVGSLIDWAWTGHIVSYCENSLLLWNPAEDIITKYDLENVVTLAYHPYYRFLATANHRHKSRPSVNVWTFERGAMLNCFSHRPKSNHIVTTLCWHKHGIQLLTGNVRGVIGTLDFYGSKKLFHLTPPVHSVIKDIKFSATSQYVASLDIMGKLCIWSYNSGYLKLHHVWNSRLPTKASMDWHPWSEFDLVLCIQRNCLVLVLNILSKAREAYSTGRDFIFDRPVVSFNRISAELVVGCQKKTRNGIHKNILVLGAVDKVVDELKDVGTVNTGFMWSPNNEQLAFVAGNDIQIYNFFGTSTSTSLAIARVATNSANLTENSFSIFKQFDFIK